MIYHENKELLYLNLRFLSTPLTVFIHDTKLTCTASLSNQINFEFFFIYSISEGP